jgi:hypothetical protein
VTTCGVTPLVKSHLTFYRSILNKMANLELGSEVTIGEEEEVIILNLICCDAFLICRILQTLFLGSVNSQPPCPPTAASGDELLSVGEMF